LTNWEGFKYRTIGLWRWWLTAIMIIFIGLLFVVILPIFTLIDTVVLFFSSTYKPKKGKSNASN